MNRRLKAKLPLIGSLSVSLFALLTAGVSTFAWYQANIEASISSVESSVTITTAPPEGNSFNGLNLYAYTGNADGGYSGDATGSIADPNNLVNFTAITNDNKGTLLSLSGLLPGRKMSFGFSASAQKAVNSATLKLTSYSTTNNTYRKVLTSVTDGGSGTVGKYSNNQDMIIRIEDAIKFYGVVNSTGDFALGTSSTLGNYNKDYTAGSGYTSKTYSPTSTVTISQGTSLNASVIYYFYTIEFSNDPETYYQEYTYDNNVYNKCESVIANNYSGNRYFNKVSTGDSSCYEGLSFALLELEAGAE